MTKPTQISRKKTISKIRKLAPGSVDKGGYGSGARSSETAFDRGFYYAVNCIIKVLEEA